MRDKKREKEFNLFASPHQNVQQIFIDLYSLDWIDWNSVFYLIIISPITPIFLSYTHPIFSLYFTYIPPKLPSIFPSVIPLYHPYIPPISPLHPHYIPPISPLCSP